MTASSLELAPGGVLRAAINLGNPVLAQGDASAPAGLTVELAAELARRLGASVEYLCFDAARTAADAVASGQADLGFLAIDPKRAEVLAFTEPYVLIEGVYAVPEGSALRAPEEVDREGVRVGVKEGSAYDLHLTRELEHAEIVRGAEGTAVFDEQSLEVVAGIRQPIEAFAVERGLRVLEPAFMQIRQAMAVSAERPAAAEQLRGLARELVASGFVAEALRRAGQDPSIAA